MLILPHGSPQPQPFSGDYAALEVGFHRRWADTGHELIAMLFAEDGDCRAGVRIAYEQGVRQFSFLCDDDRHLWLAAAFCPVDLHVWRFGWMALQQQGSATARADYDHLCGSWYWAPNHVQRTATELARLERMAWELRETANHYRALLAGEVEPRIELRIPHTNKQVAA